MEREQAVSTIANLEEKISLLERVNLDLELRLEQKARESMLLEGECLESQRSGQLRIQSLEMDIRMWKVECAAQDIRNKELKEMLSRTEMEMHSIFQRKSEHGKSRPSSGVHLQQHQRTVQRSPSNSALMDAISDKEPVRIFSAVFVFPPVFAFCKLYFHSG